MLRCFPGVEPFVEAPLVGAGSLGAASSGVQGPATGLGLNPQAGFMVTGPSTYLMASNVGEMNTSAAESAQPGAAGAGQE